LNEDEIQINFPSRVPDALKDVAGLSDAMKSHIAKRVADGLINLQVSNKESIPDIDSKCDMIIDVLEDRSQFDKVVTKDEIEEIIDSDDKYFASFIQKLMKTARDRGIEIKKTKKGGKTCYKI
jgi:hypothetical protein